MMPTSDNEKKIKQILVAIDTSPDSLAALEMGAELAAKLGADLNGIFVEDINLHRIATLPFAREIGYLTGSIRKLDNTLVNREFRTLARQAYQAMELLAKRRNLRWSFRRVQGVIPKELISAASDADLILLGKSGWSKRKLIGSTAKVVLINSPLQSFFLRPGIQIGLPTVVIFDGSPIAWKALHVALQIHSGDHPLTILVPATDEQVANQLQSDALGEAERAGTSVELNWITDLNQVILARMTKSSNCGILILPAESKFISGESLIELLDQTDCGVLIIR
jgi:nucleotide-binding universal stress UspA family protein